MNSVFYSLVFFVLALGILITVHEFGHFWVARKLGVKVLRFSIGFGRPLWTITRGVDRTEYVVAAVPLGGYVKMLDEREGDVPPEDLDRTFNRKPVTSRILIVSAGPVANFLLAILLYWLIFLIGLPGSQPFVGGVSNGSLAERAGIQVNDRIMAVNGKNSPTMEVVRLQLLNGILDGESVVVKVLRTNGEFADIDLPTDQVQTDKIQDGLLIQLGIIPRRPELPAKIGYLEPSGAGSVSGMAMGDQVLSIDGKIVENWTDMANRVRKSPGQSMRFIVDRNGERMEIEVIPRSIDVDGGAVGQVGARPFVPEGFIERYRAYERYDWLEAIPAAMSKTWDMSVLTLRMLGKIVTGEASVKNLSGPVSIAQFAGQTARIGWIPFLSFLAVISISLGVLNLLPVPVLDGGHLLFYFAEVIKGSPLSDSVQIAGQKIGLVMLLLLMSVAFYNDLARVFG